MKAMTVEFCPGSREELLPDFDPAFPYIQTRAGFREGESAPWHWHKAVELFYVESGTLEYVTPSGSHVFTAGTGGFVNSNVLHMTRGYHVKKSNCHFLHLFDPVLISGGQGSRIEEKFVLPLTTAVPLELIVPEDPELLKKLRASFDISEAIPDYEIRLRQALTDIWFGLLEQVRPQLERQSGLGTASAQIKQMLVYIHENYGEKLTVRELARAACVSERSCYELFRKNLRTTPVDYINSYRLRMACRLLTQTEESVTRISGECGMNNSYFCQLFREATGFTPLEYRRFHKRHETGGREHFR